MKTGSQSKVTLAFIGLFGLVALALIVFLVVIPKPGQDSAVQTAVQDEPSAIKPVREAKVVYIEGDVEIRRGSSAFEPDFGTVIQMADIVVTGNDGMLELQFGSLGAARILPDSEVKISTISLTPSSSAAGIEVVAGSVLNKVKSLQGTDSYSIRTGETVCGVRGTEFMVTVSQEQTLVAVSEGRVTVVPASPILDELLTQSLTNAVAQAAIAEIVSLAPTVGPAQELVVSQEEVAQAEVAYGEIAKEVEETPPVPIAEAASQAVPDAAPVLIPVEAVTVEKTEETEKVQKSVKAKIEQSAAKPVEISDESNEKLKDIEEFKPLPAPESEAPGASGDTPAASGTSGSGTETTGASVENPAASGTTGSGTATTGSSAASAGSSSSTAGSAGASASASSGTSSGKSGATPAATGTTGSGTATTGSSGKTGSSGSATSASGTGSSATATTGSATTTGTATAATLGAPSKIEPVLGSSLAAGKKVVGNLSYASGSGVVIATDADGNISFFGKGGARVAMASTGVPNVSASYVTVLKGRVYYVINNTLYCFNASDGSKVFQKSYDPATQSVLMGARPVAFENRIILPIYGGLLVVDSSNGEIQKSIEVSAAPSMTPAVWKGKFVLAVDGEGNFLAIDGNSGEVAWSVAAGLNAPSALAPRIFDDKAVIVDRKGKMAFVDLNAKSILWTKNLGEPVHTDVEIARDGVFAFGAKSGTIWGFSLRGDALFSPIPGSTCPPLLAGGKLFYGNPAGNLVVIAAANGAKIAELAVGDAISARPLIDEAGVLWLATKGGRVLRVSVDVLLAK